MVSTTKISVISCLIIVFTCQFSKAQTWGEFFNQKKTQKKYLLQQIAALQVYIGYAKKGYDIAQNGLTTIKDITNGEFSLHNSFITSLKVVSPVIRKNAKIVEIIETQIRIAKAFNSIKRSHILSISNQLYIIDVKDNLINECGNDLEDLLLVITSGRLEMSDKERLRRIDLIHSSMVDKYAFTIDFTEQVMSLIYQAENQQKSINHLRRTYGIEIE